MHDEITVKLTIASNTLSAEDIAVLLDMNPDSSQILGQINRLGTKTYPQHAWIVKSQHEFSGESLAEQIETQVSQFLGRLAPASSAIATLSAEQHVELGIYIFAREVPPLGFSSQQVGAIAALGASVDIDVILYAEDEEGVPGGGKRRGDDDKGTDGR